MIREQRFDLFMLLYFGVTELTLEIYYRQQDKRYLCAVSEKKRDEVKKKKKSYSEQKKRYLFEISKKKINEVKKKKKKLQCYESQHCFKKT